MKKFYRFTPYALSLIILAVFVLIETHTALAADTKPEGYILLETVGGSAAGTVAPGFAKFLQNVFQYLIRIGGIIAVVSLVISGVEYTASGISESRKNDARARINNVFIGLAGALSAYFILNFINPNLVTFNLDIPQINTTVQNQTGSTAIGGQSVPSTPGGSSSASSAAGGNSSVDLAENSAVQQQLASGGITLGYRTPCNSAGDSGCVTLAGLPQKAITGLFNLKAECNCAVQVNGATEKNGHTAGTDHGPGNAIVDVQETPEINAFVLKDGNKAFRQSGGNKYDQYRTSLGVFQDERASKHHWHIIFN